jgi:hypothetical protein
VDPGGSPRLCARRRVRCGDRRHLARASSRQRGCTEPAGPRAWVTERYAEPAAGAAPGIAARAATLARA